MKHFVKNNKMNIFRLRESQRDLSQEKAYS